MTVSFLIAAHNEQEFLEECIDSCFVQEGDHEVQVCTVDDGSTDRTAEILSNLQVRYPNLLVDVFPSNRGKVAAFNRAFERSTGEIIALIGADDVNLPIRLKTMVPVLSQAAVACSDLIPFRDSVRYQPLVRARYGYRSNREFSFGELLRLQVVYGNTLMARREAWAPLFPIPSDLDHEDWYLSLKSALANGPISFVPSPTINYRIHQLQTSAVDPRDSARLQKWRRRLSRDLPMYERLLEEPDLDPLDRRFVEDRVQLLRLYRRRHVDLGTLFAPTLTAIERLMAFFIITCGYRVGYAVYRLGRHVRERKMFRPA